MQPREMRRKSGSPSSCSAACRKGQGNHSRPVVEVQAPGRRVRPDQQTAQQVRRGLVRDGLEHIVQGLYGKGIHGEVPADGKKGQGQAGQQLPEAAATASRSRRSSSQIAICIKGPPEEKCIITHYV